MHVRRIVRGAGLVAAALLSAGHVPPAHAATADLSVTMTDSPDPYVDELHRADGVTYTITVTNNGPNAATDVVLTDANFRYAGISTSQGSCTYASADNTVECELGSLSAGSSATVELGVYVCTMPVITNTATVSAATSDPLSLTNAATELTAPMLGDTACGA